jgi:two-component system nitrogen regulation response regulator NtrX
MRLNVCCVDTVKNGEAKSDFERAFILDKLQENQLNVSKTAEAIGFQRRNLHRKLKSFNSYSKQLSG